MYFFMAIYVCICICIYIGTIQIKTQDFSVPCHTFIEQPGQMHPGREGTAVTMPRVSAHAIEGL